MNIDRKTDALLVIDVQNDFLPGGALAVNDGFAIIDPILALLPRFDTVVASQDWHPARHVSFASTFEKSPFQEVTLASDKASRTQMLWPDHCVQGTEGADFPIKAKERLNVAATMIIRKGTDASTDSYSAFRENVTPSGDRPVTGLAGYLASRGIKRVFVVGLAYDYCVVWTAKDAAANGFEAVIIENCTRAVFPQNNEQTKADLNAAGVKVIP